MKIVPREPQKLAIAAAVPALRKNKRALVVLATAIGKTITSALIAKELKVKKVLFLVHNNFILDNSLKEYKKVFREKCTYALYNGLTKSGANTADFVFASLQTMGKNLNKWHKNHFDLVVVDESHHSHAETYRPTIEYFLAMRLGITATPNRTDLLDIRTLFGEEVINIPLEEAIARGWLPRIEYHVVTDNGFDGEALSRLTKEVLEGGARISLDELNRRVFVKARDEKIAEIIEGYNDKTLVFCRNIAHAENFCAHLKSSAVFHSETGRYAKETWKINQVVLDDFRNGLLLRVLAVNAFNEGVDVPSIGLVVFLRTTESQTIFLQQLGRGCRPGKEKLVVLDFVGNIERVIRLKEMRDDIARYYEDNTTIIDRDNDGYTNTPIQLSGRGFEFTFSTKLVDLMQVVDRAQTNLYPTWQEASQAAIKLRIKNYEEYLQHYKEDPCLPRNLHKKYPDFPGIAVFLRQKYPTWQEAARAFKKAWGNRKNHRLVSTDYRTHYKEKNDPLLPKWPPTYYPDFPGWDKFFGRRKKKDYYTCDEAMAVVKEIGFKSRRDYELNCKSYDKRLVCNPRNKYSDFPGWEVFLGQKPAKK